MSKKVIFVSACALIDADGRILMTKRPADKDFSGMWEFPGGKMEENEQPEDTVIRELREELGIEPCRRCLQPFSFVSHEYEDFHLFMPLFLCRQWDGFPRPVEGQEIKWVFPGRLSELELVPADVPLAQEIRDRLPDGRRYE